VVVPLATGCAPEPHTWPRREPRPSV